MAADSVDAVFCSHVLEHLSLDDFHAALENTRKVLRPGGIFRLIVPDLRMDVEDYSLAVRSESSETRAMAAIDFCRNTCMGRARRDRSWRGLMSNLLGNSFHLWMWDEDSIKASLQKHGFADIRPFSKGDADDEVLLRPERAHQFERCIALQCKKPQD